jgi:C4-dicarboxylate-specific signal transduction histidine kinase
MLNLILNAIEAMIGSSEAARELLIRTEQDESGGVRVSMEDSGSGLKPDSLDQTFNEFHTTKPGGIGRDCRSAVRSSRRMADAYGR